MNRKIRAIQWGEIPFFFITTPLAIAITIAYFYPQTHFSALALFSTATLPLLSFFIPLSPFHFLYPIRNALVPILALTAVFLLWILSQQTWRKYSVKSGNTHHLTIVEVKKKSSFAKFNDGEVVFLRSNQFQAGDQITVEGTLRRIRPKRLSDTSDFDFYTYATRKNIRYSLKPHRVALVGRAPWTSIHLHALRWRDHLGQSLTQGSRYGGWVKAILFGDDREIEGDALTLFQQTGTLHVLAVSGMHVSVLFTVVDALLKLLPGFRRWPWIRFLAGNGTLWMYALVSGFTPSIARSAWMFSLGSLGKLIHREGIALNHLFASAFFILLLEPTHLFHLGFQLSFIAVGSILLFEPWFTHLFSWNSWIGKKLGAALGVSTAAQFGTAPLGFFYFHSFPIWFLPANLIAVPLSSFLLLLFLLLLPLHLFLPNTIRLFLLDQPIHTFIRIMSVFEKLPFASLTGEISWEQVWIFFLGILLFRNAIIFPSIQQGIMILLIFLTGILWPFYG
jgi:ComEC/Rec2-related protein